MRLKDGTISWSELNDRSFDRGGDSTLMCVYEICSWCGRSI